MMIWIGSSVMALGMGSSLMGIVNFFSMPQTFFTLLPTELGLQTTQLGLLSFIFGFPF